MEEILIKIENLKKWIGLGIIVTTNNTDLQLTEMIEDLHSKVKNLNIPTVSGSLADLLAEFLIDTNKRGTIGRGKYVDIAKDFLKSRGFSQ